MDSLGKALTSAGRSLRLQKNIWLNPTRDGIIKTEIFNQNGKVIQTEKKKIKSKPAETKKPIKSAKKKDAGKE